jgi:hypothetical protein
MIILKSESNSIIRHQLNTASTYLQSKRQTSPKSLSTELDQSTKVTKITQNQFSRFWRAIGGKVLLHEL